MLHYNMSKHPITLNIKQVLKVFSHFPYNLIQEPEERAKPAQITKLAIGKPGGIDPEVDNYDTIVSLKCLACEKQLDHTNPMVAGLIDSVLLS